MVMEEYNEEKYAKIRNKCIYRVCFFLFFIMVSCTLSDIQEFISPFDINFCVTKKSIELLLLSFLLQFPYHIYFFLHSCYN